MLNPDEEFKVMDKRIYEKLSDSTTLSAREIIQMLNPIEQQILSLHVCGFIYKEIGEMLNKSESAVKIIVSRAKRKFRKLYLQKYKSPIYLGGEQNEKK